MLNLAVRPGIFLKFHLLRICQNSVNFLKSWKINKDFDFLYSLLSSPMKGKGLTKLERFKVCELHQEGKKIDEIAHLFEVHKMTIYRILREKKKAPRKRGRPHKLSSVQQLHLQ